VASRNAQLKPESPGEQALTGAFFFKSSIGFTALLLHSAQYNRNY
jgi:hypothetical protein